MMELSEIQNKIYEIRGTRVMLDRDLAEMYGVETRVLKQAVRRNTERFPDDFMFELTKAESDSLRSQIVILKNEGRGQHSKYLPYAFTELGVAMLSSVLNSKIAIQINMSIMRAFVAVRQLLANPPADEVKLLQKEVKELKEYIEEVFADYNDINEDNQKSFDEIYYALSELAAKQKLKQDEQKKRRPVGFIKPKEED
ncbi:ORF6N domain-containing protein [Dysgonomonas sp. 25]|uniref:ORF6N domain-containing protein n=1 Tax=Dysgonomonas sp. 25 TaxID=2302933 RepID=UPI0013D348BB|nr:ORF6N domain-containing protein [Dysgonomonas sp. 25]